MKCSSIHKLYKLGGNSQRFELFKIKFKNPKGPAFLYKLSPLFTKLFKREREMIKVGKMVELMEEYSLMMARMREEINFLPRRRRIEFQFLRSLHSAFTSTSADSSFFMYF